MRLGSEGGYPFWCLSGWVLSMLGVWVYMYSDSFLFRLAVLGQILVYVHQSPGPSVLRLHKYGWGPPPVGVTSYPGVVVFLNLSW